MGPSGVLLNEPIMVGNDWENLHGFNSSKSLLNSPKMPTSDASLSEWTCFVESWNSLRVENKFKLITGFEESSFSHTDGQSMSNARCIFGRKL